MTNTHQTRESWLTAAVDLIDQTVFAGDVGQRMPDKFRVGVGFPSKRATSIKNKSIGQCWSPTSSKDGATELFISPVTDEPNRVLDILAHEMVHAVVGCACGHKGEFARVARKIGLTGKLTATVAGPALLAKFGPICEALGPYPHAALNPGSEIKKQSTRLLKCECEECGYVVRTTSKWLEDAGAPLCPCNSEPMAVV